MSKKFKVWVSGAVAVLLFLIVIPLLWQYPSDVTAGLALLLTSTSPILFIGLNYWISK